MTSNSTKSSASQSEAERAVHLLDDWFDPIEVGLRDRVREFIQVMIERELETALARPRYGRRPMTDPENADDPSGISGYRHGHRSRSLMGTFGRVEITVPRARLDTAAGKTTEWESAALRAYERRTKQADWDTWNARPLGEEPIIRLILDGTVVRVRLDRKATAIVRLVVLGGREDG